MFMIRALYNYFWIIVSESTFFICDIYFRPVKPYLFTYDTVHLD